MKNNLEEVATAAIATAIRNFYDALTNKIDRVSIRDVMRHKNPYLYRARAVVSATEIVDAVLRATVSSSEETIFGNLFFEPLALAVSGGNKSTAQGLDIDIANPSANEIIGIAVKSGTSIFNSSSKKKQDEDMRKARTRVQQSRGVHFKGIVGYGYGRKKSGSKGSYIFEELAGQAFWEFLTGEPDFYKKIADYMDGAPAKYAASFKEHYTLAENRLLKQFVDAFCKDDGSIDWDKLIEFNSGSAEERDRVKHGLATPPA